jgi:glucans biosynthesis protein C
MKWESNRTNNKRDYYIDRLRIFLTALVIFHHSAIAFGAAGGWYYVTNETTSGTLQLLLSAQMAVNQAFFMSLFFFVSALFMPASYDRKGFRKFVSDRLVRLGIPLLFYVLVIHPILVYFILKHVGRETGEFFSFWKIMITKHAEPGPMWFVLTLLVFELCYALFRKFMKNKIAAINKPQAPSWITIVGFMALTGAVAFAIRLVFPVGKSWFGLQFGYFSLYVAMYLVGIVAARKQWPEKLEISYALPWFGLALLAIPAMLMLMAKNSENLTPVMGGTNWKAAFYAFWEPIVCIGFCYFLPLLFKKIGDKPNRFVITQSGNSYLAYIIHPVLVVFSTFWVEQVTVPPSARLLIVLTISIIGSFGISHLIRFLPGIKKVL